MEHRLGGTGWRLRLLPALCLTIVGLYPLLFEGSLLVQALDAPPDGWLGLAAAVEAGSVPALLVLLVIAPLIEELLFRGLILRGLEALFPATLAILLSAAMFAAFHGDVSQLLPAFTAGVLFGWLYVKTESLFLPILGHIFWNAQLLLLDRWPWLDLPAAAELARFAGEPPVQPVWWLGVCGVAAVGGAVALGSAIRRAERPARLA
ncbi:MAG TPA: CPBP family intramembrane glutamic endopeptidase [Longimicrobiales bacterium]